MPSASAWAAAAEPTEVGDARATCSARNGPSAGTGDAADADAPAWTTLARVLLNLDEFITRE